MSSKNREISMVVEKRGVSKIEPWEFDIPEIGENDGLLRVTMVGVCSSDAKNFYGAPTRPESAFPLIMGHEINGVIERLGSKAAARWGVKPGDRVIVVATSGCGHCLTCVRGMPEYCRQPEAIGYGYRTSCRIPPHLWGGYGQYLYLHPGAIVFPFHTDLPDEAAVLVGAAIGNAVHWVRQAGQVSLGDAVVVQGAGPQGLCATAIARECGASPIIVTGLSRDRARLAMAAEFGADYTIDVEKEEVVSRVRELTRGNMADLVIDVSGSPAGVPVSIELVRPMGTVVYGSLTGAKKAELVTDKLALNEIRYQGVFSHNAKSALEALRLAETRKYPFEKLVTHKLPLKEAERGLALVYGKVEGESPIKVVLEPWR
ncbi:MAG: zinc-binding dehydrogenase [Chloroflexota bacterium]